MAHVEPQAAAGSLIDRALGAREEENGTRAAWLTFLVVLVLGSGYTLMVLGRDRWFFSDEWNVIAGRDVGTFRDLFAPNNAHWTTLPTVVYDVLWRTVGIRSYLPYQLISVASHAVVVILVRATMRRAGVAPWLATVASAGLIIFGPGSDNIVWAFQITMTGAIALGLVQLLLADHEGSIDRRDALGLGAGVLALMCSGVGVAMVAAVGVSTLARRGWRVAALHVAPPAIIYLTWYLLASPQSESPGGRPTLRVLAQWMLDTVSGTFLALAEMAALAVLLGAATILGTVLIVVSGPGGGRRRQLAAPVGLVVAASAFAVLTAQGRWHLGPETARSGRYMYVTAALSLPLVAVALQALCRRSRIVLPVAIVLLLIPIPAHIRDFRGPVYNERYFDNHERIIGTAPYAPFADEVPPDVRPLHNPFIVEQLDIGFLRSARDEGKLDPPALPLPPRLVNEMSIRLGLAQRPGSTRTEGCTVRRRPVRLSPRKGETYPLAGPVSVTTVTARRATSDPVTFLPRDGGRLTVELEGLELRISPLPGTQLTWCEPS